MSLQACLYKPCLYSHLSTGMSLQALSHVTTSHLSTVMSLRACLYKLSHMSLQAISHKLRATLTSCLQRQSKSPLPCNGISNRLTWQVQEWAFDLASSTRSFQGVKSKCPPSMCTRSQATPEFAPRYSGTCARPKQENARDKRYARRGIYRVKSANMAAYALNGSCIHSLEPMRP